MRSGPRFQGLAESLERVKAVGSKTAKVNVISSYLAGLGPEDEEIAARLSTGRASERGSRDEVQVGYSTIIGILEEVCSPGPGEISKIYLRHGDLGEVAEEMLGRKKETTLFSEPLTLGELEASFAKLRRLKGKGAMSARKGIVKSMLLRTNPLEGKYLVKILTGEMRTGLVQGLLEEAIAKAHSLPAAEVARAHMLVGDVGLLARAAAEDRLADLHLVQFRPVNFMLAEPIASAREIAEAFRKEVYAEFKYDGVRSQIHKLGPEVRMYSRRLEDVTSSFPEVARSAAAIAHDFVVDGEIVPFRDGRPLPFQLLQRRLRRVKDFELAAEQAPVRFFAFDILLLDGQELFGLPLRMRSERLDSVLAGGELERARRSAATSESDLGRLFRQSRELGYEGLVVKDPDSAYTMGRRGAGWVKLKEELDTIDAVIVAAEYGHGKRVGVISDYTFAVRGEGGLKTIGKAYSGLTDQEIESMTERLKRITLTDFGYRRLVRPEVVIEVAFDSIQKSGRHDSGYALRFPRIKRIREDKSPEDIDTMDKVKDIFEAQRVKLEGT